MTYTEIHERRWDGVGADLVGHSKRFIAALPEPDRTAYRIIEMLLSRKGFEYWWNPNAVGGMDAECNDDIFEELKRIITNGGGGSMRPNDPDQRTARNTP